MSFIKRLFGRKKKKKAPEPETFSPHQTVIGANTTEQVREVNEQKEKRKKGFKSLMLGGLNSLLSNFGTGNSGRQEKNKLG